MVIGIVPKRIDDAVIAYAKPEMIFCRRYFFDIGPGSLAVIQLGELYLNSTLISLVNSGKCLFCTI